MNNKNIFKIASDFYKIALVENLTLYHGTDGRKFPKIMETGLDPLKSTSSKHVFLTPDFQKAARYGAWSGEYMHSIPMILEIKLSGKQNIKKIYRDPLDHPNGWYEYGEDMHDDGKEELISFKEDVENAFGYLPYFLENSDDWENVFGNNFYKAMIFENHEDDKNKIKKILFNKFMPVDINNYAQIANNGTIVPSEYFYLSMHQQKYSKKIPPSAIKNVWVIVNDFYENEEAKEFAPKLLPWEGKQYFNFFKNQIQNIYFSDFSIKELKKITENLIDEDDHRIFSDILSDIQSQLSERNDEEKLSEHEISELFYPIENEINNRWGQDILSNKIDYRWVKMSPENALKYVHEKL